ncbi:ribbon-helix-helix protein, CopG family [Nocardioides alkalitolerans]|nr:ribbon-helix-helix protein, CopG family [Nocardioides alkalitolerans]
MNGQGTTRRTVRVADPLWTDALTLAERRGETVSEIIRKALRAYVAEHA